MQMPRRYVLALHGRRGGGKSTVAFSAFTRPHIVTSEMDTDVVLAYLDRVGVEHGGMSVPQLVEDEYGPRIDLGRVADGVHDLILDSASATAHPLLAVMAVRDWVDRVGGRAIVILQHTKDGEPAGEAKMLHACDGEAEVVNDGGRRRLTLHKHRRGESGISVPFGLGAEGVVAEVPAHYYSIEGRGSSLRLVPWPSPESGPYAAYLRAVERSLEDDEAPTLRLPPPPVAVCALRSALHRAGWADPADVVERRAAATAAGIPYFSPVEP